MKSIVLILFCTSFAAAQFDNRTTELPLDTLATIGTHIVNGTDFLERFELMPWPNKEQVSRIEFSKLEFLYSMVAEKLMAIEASSKNIGNDSASLSLQYNLERLYVRDELYKQDVLPNISITDQERLEGMYRFPYEIETQVLGILTKQEGELLLKKVSQSKNHGKTLRQFKDSLYVILDTLQVTYGFSDKKIEDAVFSIGKDSLSKPMETQYYGLVIFHVMKKYSNEKNTGLSNSDRLHKVENIIKQRKEDSIAVKAFASITSPQRAEANPEIFYRLADSVLAILIADSAEFQSNGTYKFPLKAIETLRNKFSSELTKQFITIESGPMTLGDVLLGLTNNAVLFPSLKLEHVRIVLNNNIKTVIQNELLSREGLKRNLQQTKSVQHDLATWMDSRKNWLLTHAVIDTVQVNNDEIEAEYRNHPQQYGATLMVRFREILVDSLSQAKELAMRLKKGDEFSSLSRKYSKRKEWAAHDGESPWVDASKMGELGIMASSANVGELYGPLKINDGYTIYSVLEKRVLDDSLRANFGKTAYSIQQKLLAEKKQKALDTYIGSLAKKYHVAINESALRKVKTTTTSMVTWRNIGFGGRFLAVPQMIHQTDWVYEWMKQQRLNQ